MYIVNQLYKLLEFSNDKPLELELWNSPHYMSPLNPILIFIVVLIITVVFGIISFYIINNQDKKHKEVIKNYFDNYKVEFRGEDVILISYSGEYISTTFKTALDYANNVDKSLSIK